MLFDNLIADLLKRESIDTVINLAAGLDSRPFRLDLPRNLRWVEIDLPEIVTHKEPILSGETPRCTREVRAENLADANQRRRTFAELNSRSAKVLVLSEGLLAYLTPEQVAELAADLHAQPRFQYWMVEVISPKVLEFVRRKFGKHLDAAGARMHFAPPDWRGFYQANGWNVADFKSISETAYQFRREPFLMKALRIIGAPFPAWSRKQTLQWESGVALLRR